MEIPHYEPFYIHSEQALREEIARLGLDLPLESDFSVLASPLRIAGKQISNRFCAQPIFGNDALSNGAPGPLTLRRYSGYARGGFGLIWLENTDALTTRKPGRLCISENTLESFASLIYRIRAEATQSPVLILQIVAEDPSRLLAAAHLAHRAGFDGVDIQHTRTALPSVLAQIRVALPDLLLACRLCVYEAVRGGFGAATHDYRKYDLHDPLQCIALLKSAGLDLLNVTTSAPRLRGTHRGIRALTEWEPPDEHPLTALARHVNITRSLREKNPTLPLVGSGFSWLRNFIPPVASAAINTAGLDLIGLGRAALAFPEYPMRILARKMSEPSVRESTCMVCFACSELAHEGREVGCVLRDPQTYGAPYRQMRRFDADRLAEGAARCHLCEAAPCVTHSPTRVDIPGFIDAFRRGDETAAYEILRARNPLPEMTAQCSPGWMEEEGACIETVLKGSPVPIQDLFYTVAWRARKAGRSGIRVPATTSERQVAVVGGGPAGLAATARLVELGHPVEIFESTSILGGVPARLLARHRSISNPREEIEALLQPAIRAGRLKIHFQKKLGTDLQISRLKNDYDAVLVTIGLWQERSLGMAGGVIGALDFLEQGFAKKPERVALLAGGDSAMDAARALQQAGVSKIDVIFRGPRSEMHWHMPESWFATPGVNFMPLWDPLEYVVDDFNRIQAVRIRHTRLGIETHLPADLVVEAMGLEPTGDFRDDEQTKRIHVAGARINGGTSIGHCIAEGLAMADRIHLQLTR